jgi:hypothetical protein
MSKMIRKTSQILHDVAPHMPRTGNPSLGPIIADRIAYLCASELLRMEGEDAVLTAADRADEALGRSDTEQYSYWRRVESAMQIILLEDVIGEIH